MRSAIIVVLILFLVGPFFCEENSRIFFSRCTIAKRYYNNNKLINVNLHYLHVTLKFIFGR